MSVDANNWMSAMSLRFVPDPLRRITSRGWRSNIILFVSFTAAFVFLFMFWGTGDGEIIRVVHGDNRPELPPINEGQSTTALSEVLNNIIIDASLQFRPDGKDVQDFDIAHLSRQTAVMKDLLRIHDRLPTTTRELQEEKDAFRHTIETMQQTLYPWITKPKNGNSTYHSFFDLINSYTQDAGVVISTGKNGGFRWAVHQIITLRGVLNSTLPIEVFYGGDDDLPENYQHFIAGIEAAFPDSGTITPIDITKMFPDPDGVLGLPGGWAMRPFAILASSFKTAILADADTIFLQDPRIILEEPTFKQYGSIFWHDRTLSPASDETYKWADQLLESAKAKNMDKVQEAGCGAVIVDKVRNIAGALMTCHLNSQKVRDEITYRRFYGDKESYWYAHALTSTPYHFVPGYSGGIGRLSYEKEDGKPDMEKEVICTLQLLHTLESTGEPFWFNNAITEYKGTDDTHYIVPEVWIPQGGRWHGGETRFPNEFCVTMPESERDRMLGLPDHVRRVEGDLKVRLDKMIQEVARYDELMEKEGLVKISR